MTKLTPCAGTFVTLTLTGTLKASTWIGSDVVTESPCPVVGNAGVNMIVRWPVCSV